MLPELLVDRLFSRLTLRYGVAFCRQWPDADMAAVKADWAVVLHGITADTIKAALERLPVDKPPNANQFRRLCVECIPGPERQVFTALPAPRVQMPDHVKAKLQAMRQRREQAGEERMQHVVEGLQRAPFYAEAE